MGANLPTWHWKKAVTQAMMMPSAAMTTNMPQGSEARAQLKLPTFLFLVWHGKRIGSSWCHKRRNVMQTHTSNLYLYFSVQIYTSCLGKIQDFTSRILLCPDHKTKKSQGEWPYGLVTAWNKANDVAREVISHTRKKKTMRKRPLKPCSFTISNSGPRDQAPAKKAHRVQGFKGYQKDKVSSCL